MDQLLIYHASSSYGYFSCWNLLLLQISKLKMLDRLLEWWKFIFLTILSCILYSSRHWFFIFFTVSEGKDRDIVFEFAIISRTSISWVGSKIYFLKFLTTPRWGRKITESHVVNSSSKVFPKITKSSKNIITWIIKYFSTNTGTFNNLVKTLGAGPS